MIELKGITWDHPRGFDPLDASSQRYLQERGIRVTWHKRTLKDFGDTSVEILANNYDLLVIDHPHMGAVSSTGCVVNLDNYLSADETSLFNSESVGPSFLSYRYSGSQWALPVDAACQAAAYRSDLLDKASLPATWSEVIKLAETLRTQKQFIGTALCATDCNCIFLTLCAQKGNPVTENGEGLVPMSAGVEVLHLMEAVKEVSHPESLNWSPILLYNHMTAFNEVVYSPLAFAYVNYATGSNGANALEYASIPGSTRAILGGAGLAASSKSSYIKEAVDYIRWICDPQYQKTHYWAEGGQPGQLSAWRDMHADTHSGNFFSSVLPIINSAYVRPRLPLWPQYQEWLGDMVHDYLKNNSDPEKLIKTINAEYKRMFN